MIRARSEPNVVHAIVAAAVGLGAWVMTDASFGLLMPIIALFYCASERMLRILFPVGIVVVGAALAAVMVMDGSRSLALTCAWFFAVALCTAPLVAPAATAAALGGAARGIAPGSGAGSVAGIPPDVTGALSEAPSDAMEAVRAVRVIEHLHGAAFAFDASGAFTYATPIARTLLGIGMTLEDLNRPLGDRTFLDGGDLGWKFSVHPDDYESVAARLRERLRAGEIFNGEWRLRRADGRYVWHRFVVRPTHDGRGRVSGWYGVGFDIDAYKSTETALRERGRLLKQFVDAVPAMIWSTTPSGTPAYVNKRFTDVIGCGIGDITAPDGSLTLGVVVHPDYRQAAEQALARSMETGDPYVMRYLQRRADGSYRWTATRAEPLRDETGSIMQWYGVCVDIHDMVTAEAALRESERSLHQLFETLPAMIDCALPNGEPIYRSRGLREFLGYNLEDLDGAAGSKLASTLDAGVHPDDVDGVKERYAHSLATGEPYARRHRLRRFDGEYRWVETRAAAMRNAEGTIVQWNVICLDIDGEVRAQEELRLARERVARASEAASLAELSASIAHEVNQPLAAIVANSYACNRWLSAEPPNVDRAKTTAERIIRDANAAADVVGRIRALFRQSVEMRTSTALGSLVTEACRLMADEAIRRRIRVDVDIERDLPLVSLDRVQVQQVLVNLIRNGMDAMEFIGEGRVLRLRVGAMGDVVQTEVSDRGPGIQFPERIFDPFFTTKSEGMGMGLAICRSIVESHGGRLWAEKNEPHGAKFIFTLPIEMKAAP
jgi:PAS domain S-box-containing protein